MLDFINVEMDISLLRWIHHHRIAALDPFFYYLSFSTSFISIGLLLTILIISFKERSTQLRLIFFKMLAVFIIAATISLTLKTLVSRERPFKTYPDIEKLSEGGSSSFPSGHTIEAFAIATAFTLLIKRKRFAIPLLIWAVLVAYSRMSLGVHYPSDVLTGMIIGSLTGWLIPVLAGNISYFKKE